MPVDDAREVSRCVAALERGLKKLRGGLPLCTRLLCEMHKELLTHPGGRGKTPGEVRRSQVWIGGTRPGNAVFVPPPADAVPDGLAALERFLNDAPEPVPPLLKAALVHVQFEPGPALGAGVTGLAVGDRVMGSVRGGFAQLVRARRRTSGAFLRA